MRPVITLAAVLMAVLTLTGAPHQAAAGNPFEEAKAAYDAGHYARATELWHRLALQGEVAGQYNMAYMYAHGLGVPQSYARAVRWYRVAARKGHYKAQHNLAVCYDQGLGAPEDHVMAVRWYRRAADQGAIDSQINLGLIYAEGIGEVSRAPVLAYKWFHVATRLGADGAAAYRDGVAETMTEDEVARARRMAKRWLDRYLSPTGGAVAPPDRSPRYPETLEGGPAPRAREAR